MCGRLLVVAGSAAVQGPGPYRLSVCEATVEVVAGRTVVWCQVRLVEGFCAGGTRRWEDGGETRSTRGGRPYG